MNKVTMQGVFDKVKRSTYTVLPDGVTTVCQLTLENGFSVNGHSACADPANYDQFLGEKYAYEDALRKIWPFEGYLLCERMYQDRLSANRLAAYAKDEASTPHALQAARAVSDAF